MSVSRGGSENNSDYNIDLLKNNERNVTEFKLNKNAKEVASEVKDAWFQYIGYGESPLELVIEDRLYYLTRPETKLGFVDKDLETEDEPIGCVLTVYSKAAVAKSHKEQQESVQHETELDIEFQFKAMKGDTFVTLTAPSNFWAELVDHITYGWTPVDHEQHSETESKIRSAIEPDPDVVKELTETELIVAQHLGAGMQHDEIAKVMDIKPNTVRTHAQNIGAKVKSVLELDKIERGTLGRTLRECGLSST